MKHLEWPDTLHLAAAQGWLELGNYLEANAELDNITASLRAHPDVLQIRWCVHADATSWELAAEIAGALVRLQPKNAEHWLHRSEALHKLKRTREARDLLLPAVALFPDADAILYDLACYECQLANLAEATAWLAKVFALPNCKQIKLDALADTALEPLWKHISQL